MIHFFGYFKETNHIGISSVGFEKAAIFLRNRDFRVVELIGLKDNKEVNLLYEDEEPLWITKDHHLEISSLLSNNDYTLFTHVKIELADGGDINYSAASLYVKFPDGEDIKSKTIMLLQTMGYYAAEKIFDFCSENPNMHLLEFVLGMEPEDITDELLYNKNVFITPGTIFGSNGEGYLRDSLCVSEEVLAEVLNRIITVKI